MKKNDLNELDISRILSGKWFFSMIVTALLYFAHVSFSKNFLSLTQLKLSFLDEQFIIIHSEVMMEIFQYIYLAVTLIAAFFLSFTFYRATFERLFRKEKEKESVLDEKVRTPAFPWKKDELKLIVGLKHEKLTLNKVKDPEYLVIPSVALFQNFLISGTIGTGKTASVMYSFLKQAIFYQADMREEKAGTLILDVKGNFYKQALSYAKECGREGDVILIQLGNDNKYNPLHKPYMEAIDLAERSRYVMDLFSGGAKKEKFWDTKSAQMMTECIRLMRMTESYVTLADVHNIVTNRDFLDAKLEKLEELEDDLREFDFKACTNYFYNEFDSKAETTIATIKSCVTEMTSFFASSERINASFCPPEEELNFTGFEQCINEGKIVVLAMNVAKYPKVSKTIAAYLKLDFQSEVQQRTEADNTRLNRVRPVFFISDEYQEYVTSNDASFYGLSRESKCCSIVSSQSYTSILQTLGNREAFDTLQQNLVNKIWLRTDDKLTIDTAQLLTGKEEKIKYSKNISESASDAKKSKVFGKLASEKSSISESINVSTQRDFVFEEKVFTQTLELFKAICFTANEKGMNEPYLVHLLPYFESPIKDISLKYSQEKLLQLPAPEMAETENDKTRDDILIKFN
ncbi:MAG TPA: type IV secretion system DNA-binding domain-containing protein [Anaerovoracaceae bacterium]|nr:type IV secretion system DNA-binding domain-containing protein [Anaerovoracaceae bacterium]